MSKNRVFVVFVALLVASSMSIGIGAVGAVNPDGFDFDADNAHNPEINGSLTKGTHKMAWGDTHEDFRNYEDDAGDKVLGEFEVNTTSDISSGQNVNPYSFDVHDIEDDSFGAFPRVGSDEDDPDTDDPATVDNLASALDASEWTTGGNNASDLTISDTETGTDVDAVRFDTGTGQSEHGGGEARGIYQNWTSELDTDESKRVLMVGGVVNSIDAEAMVNVTVEDESGDTKTAYIDPDGAESSIDVMATGSGTFYYQEKLDDLTTSGAGSWSNIEKINVTVYNGNADVEFYWIDLEKKGKTQIAKKWATTDDDGDDSDSDGDYDEKQTIYNGTGTINTYSLETMDSEFSDADIHDVSAPVHWKSSLVADEDFEVTADNATDYPGFDKLVTHKVRLDVPSEIDLTSSNLELRDTVEFPSGRYVDSQLVEDADEDEEIGDFTLDNGTDPSTTYSSSSRGDVIALDSTISTGQDYVLVFQYTVTDSEWDTLTDVSTDSDDGGAAAPPGGGGGGGILGFLTSIPGMLISVAGAILGGKWLLNR